MAGLLERPSASCQATIMASSAGFAGSPQGIAAADGGKAGKGFRQRIGLNGGSCQDLAAPGLRGVENLYTGNEELACR